MAVTEVLQICPSVETLIYSTKGRPKSSLKNIKKVYHCPIETCKYFKSGFFFGKIKFLKQHFVKVHKAKSFTCSKCRKNFPLEATLNRHKAVCGVIYRCPCNAKYNAYEALITHVKRKHQGSVLKYKSMMECLKAHSTVQSFQKNFDNTFKIGAIIVEDQRKQKLLYVKQKEPKSASSKETQTGMKMYKILPNINSQTQTPEQDKKTVSMQTSIESNSRKRKRFRTQNNTKTNNSSSNSVSFMSSSTQTFPLEEEQVTVHAQTLNSNKCTEENMKGQSFFNKNKTSSVDAMKLEDGPENSNSSFTFLGACMMLTGDPNLGFVSDDGSCSAKTSTDFNKFEIVMNDLLKTESNLIMCSDSETQTVFEDIFDSSYIDTYTQTCDSLFSDLNFVDIQTQTSWSVFGDNRLTEN